MLKDAAATLGGERIGAQLRSQPWRVVQEPRDERLDPPRVVRRPVAQPVQGALAAGIRRQVERRAHRVEAGVVDGRAGAPLRECGERQEIPPHVARAVERIGTGFVEMAQVG